ncbi:unnamed protein product [Linum tenue]|uniref:FAR1 domain-containing protein n=1 Tax=Linum tenue TaxID=586396 RepID=A0AAV0L630_9ROSI|nr:unnamed protein product [Linum tenue]
MKSPVTPLDSPCPDPVVRFSSDVRSSTRRGLHKTRPAPAPIVRFSIVRASTRRPSNYLHPLLQLNCVGFPSTSPMAESEKDDVENPLQKDEGTKAAISMPSDEAILAMVFDTLEGAELFYNAYAKKIGFGIRKRDSRQSRSGRMLMQKWVCSKEGYRQKKWINYAARIRKPRRLTRGGCEAMFRVNLDRDTGKSVVKSLVSAHNHKLVPSKYVHLLRSHREIKEGDEVLIESLSTVGGIEAEIEDTDLFFFCAEERRPVETDTTGSPAAARRSVRRTSIQWRTKNWGIEIGHLIEIEDQNWNRRRGFWRSMRFMVPYRRYDLGFRGAGDDPAEVVYLSAPTVPISPVGCRVSSYKGEAVVAAADEGSRRIKHYWIGKPNFRINKIHRLLIGMGTR